MTKNVLAVCQSCAEHNGGEFKNLRNTPPLFLGQCGCCKKIKACTHIQYWKNIGTQTEMVSCEDQLPAPEADVEPDNAPAAPAPKKAATKKTSVLG
jgi:hypothetical protein